MPRPLVTDRTIPFTGIVNGDKITFTRTVLVKPGGNPGGNGIFGASGAAEFTAQRVVPSGVASAPARPDSGVVTIIRGGRLSRQKQSARHAPSPSAAAPAQCPVGWQPSCSVIR
jgi:hypothetical protein